MRGPQEEAHSSPGISVCFGLKSVGITTPTTTKLDLKLVFWFLSGSQFSVYTSAGAVGRRRNWMSAFLNTKLSLQVLQVLSLLLSIAKLLCKTRRDCSTNLNLPPLQWFTELSCCVHSDPSDIRSQPVSTCSAMLWCLEWTPSWLCCCSLCSLWWWWTPLASASMYSLRWGSTTSRTHSLVAHDNIHGAPMLFPCSF